MCQLGWSKQSVDNCSEAEGSFQTKCSHIVIIDLMSERVCVCVLIDLVIPCAGCPSNTLLCPIRIPILDACEYSAVPYCSRAIEKAFGKFDLRPFIL